MAGSTTTLSAIPNFGDIDFCEYVFVAEEDRTIPKVFDKANDTMFRYCTGIRIGTTEWRPPFKDLDKVRETVLVDPFHELLSTGKADYVIEGSEYSPGIRITDVSNIMIFCDMDGDSVGKERTFAMQEVILDNTISVPSDLVDPFEIGRYVDWLASEAEVHLKNGKLNKACKRALSLSRVCGQGSLSEQLISLSQRNTEIIDNEIDAIIECIRVISMREAADVGEQVGKLEKAKGLLELQKKRISLEFDTSQEEIRESIRSVIKALLLRVNSLSGLAA